VDFGGPLGSFDRMDVYTFFDPNDTFDEGDLFFINNLGGQIGQPDQNGSTFLDLGINPQSFPDFEDGIVEGFYTSEAGQFTITQSFFCIALPPTWNFPPTPDSGTIFHELGKTQTFSVECSDPNPPDRLALVPFLISHPPGLDFTFTVTPSTPQNIWGDPVNPVTGEFSWTPTLADTYEFQFLCEDLSQLRPDNIFLTIVVSETPPEPDSDGDGVPDSQDGCPADPNKTEPGIGGCGVSDVDTDGDGTIDAQDNCPTVSTPNQTDTDGDGIGDACDEPAPEPEKNNPCDALDKATEKGNGQKKGLEKAKENNDC